MSFTKQTFPFEKEGVLSLSDATCLKELFSLMGVEMLLIGLLRHHDSFLFSCRTGSYSIGLSENISRNEVNLVISFF